MELADYIDASNVTLDVRPGTVREVLDQIVAPLAEVGVIRDRDGLVERLARREGLQSTGIGSGVAVPHCLWEELSRPRVLVGVCPEGTDYHALDDRPVQIFFLLLSPGDAVRRHVRLLARTARLARRPGVLERIRSADAPGEVVAALGAGDTDPV